MKNERAESRPRLSSRVHGSRGEDVYINEVMKGA